MTVIHSLKSVIVITVIFIFIYYENDTDTNNFIDFFKLIKKSIKIL